MILDTNALSAWRDRDADLLRVIEPALLMLPVITLGEYRYGISRSRRQESTTEWLDEIVRSVRILPVTVGTTSAYASVRLGLQLKGRPIPTNDLWIAALAIEHRVPVLSKDRHFDVVDGLQRISW